MPLVRFEIRNELSLSKPELNRSAAVENEEPKAILGAVEVAGLVGILRQLGDLAEFSAEVFNGIQEEVTVTASRCQKLTSRVKRIESALSPLEKAVLSQTSHIHFAYTAGCEWHPRIRNGRSHFVQSDLPLCIMETYEKCRDPPPLHLLDRFDVGGPGSCLRKYSDPTFFRKDLSNPSKADDVKVQRDKAHRKRKKRRLPDRNICRSRAVSTSEETNGTRISSLADDKQTASESTSTVDMPRSSNLQELSDIVDQSHLLEQSDVQEQIEAQVQSDFRDSSKPRDSITGSGYIEYVINQSPVKKPEVKLLVCDDKIGSAVPESCIEVVDDNILYNSSEDQPVPCASTVYVEKKATLESRFEKINKDEEASEIQEPKFGPGTPDRAKQNQRDFDRSYILFHEVDIVEEKQSKSQANSIDGILGTENEGENKSEQGSESDEFVDARNTIESESESEHDGVSKPNLEHYFGDISTYCSEDNSDNNDGSEDLPYESMAEDPCHDDSLDESCSGSCYPANTNVSCFLSDPLCGKALSHDETSQKPTFVAMSTLVLAEEVVPDETILREEPVASHQLLAGDCADEKISSEEPITSCPSREDAVSTEKILPEERLFRYSFFTEAIPQEKMYPEESDAKYPSLAEVFPNEILPQQPLQIFLSLAEAVPDNLMRLEEEPDAGHPSFSKAVRDEKIVPEVLDFDSKSLSVPQAILQEQISLEEVVDVYPFLAEAVPGERLLTEEPAPICLSSTKAMPIENVLPEKPLETYSSLAELPKETNLQEKSDDAHLSCAKAAPEENISADVLDSTNLSAAEAGTREQISFGEVAGFESFDQCLAEAVPDETFLPEEPLETHPSLAELPEENISDEEADDATHPAFPQAVSDETISPIALDFTLSSVAEAVPQEPISPDETVGIFPRFTEAVHDEGVLPEESVTTCLSLTKSVAETVLPEESLETYPSLAELPEEKILDEEPGDPTHPSFSQSVSDVKEAVKQEQILLEEVVGINPCLVEPVPDERDLPEEPVTTCMSLGKAVAIEKVLPEELLETYPSLAVLPEEKIWHEEAETHPSFSEAVSDENLSPEEAGTQEQILLEECVGTCLAEAVHDERGLLEEPVTTCTPLTKLIPTEKVFPEEPLEKVSQEESDDDATHPSCAKAVSDEKASPGNLASTNLSVAEAIPQEQVSLEEFSGIDPCLAEAVPDERVLTEEPATTCLSSTKAAPIEKILPEESFGVYRSSEELPEEKIVQEEGPDYAANPSISEAVGDENNSLLEGPVSTYPSLEKSVTHDKISHEELVGTNPFLDLTVPEERTFQDQPGITYQSSAEAVSEEKTLPEETLPTYPSLGEAIADEQISVGEPDEKISVEEPDEDISVGEPNENIPVEELDATCLPSAKVIFDEKIPGSEAPGSTTEAGLHGETFPEEPVATDLSLADVISDEQISGSISPRSPTEMDPHNKTFREELVATDLSLVENVFDGKISESEAPGSTREAEAHDKTSSEEPVVSDRLLYLAVPDEPDITYQASAEAVSKEINLPGEALPTYPNISVEELENISVEEHDEEISEVEPDEKIPVEEPDATWSPSAEVVFDEKIAGSETPRSITEAGPHDKAFPEEPVVTDLSLAEPVPDDNILPKEPAATYLNLAEGIPDQQVFLDDAAFLSFAEAIFEQKFSPEVPDPTYPSLTEPELPAVSPSLVKENKAYDEPNTGPDVSVDQKSGKLNGGVTVTVSPDTQDSQSNGVNVEPVSIWSNGGLFGLAPLKPPVFAEPKREHTQNQIEGSVLATRKQESPSKSVEDTEKSSRSLVVSDPNSQQHSYKLSHSNGSPTHLQSTPTSFKVFGLSHKLLMAGFRGNSSSTCKFEAIPSTSYDTKVPAIEDNTQRTLGGSRFEEQLDYESSLFGSPSASPPVEHMKISFHTKDLSSISKLNLRIPNQSQHNGEFPSFQLVPEISNSDDEDSDIFCQSPPCVSDNCLSDSELWESDESPRKSLSSSQQEAGERSRHGEIGSFSGSFLDLPCFDSVDNHQSSSSRTEREQEQEQVPEYKPSVSEIIRDWPPNTPKTDPSNEADTLLKKTQNQSAGLVIQDDAGER